MAERKIVNCGEAMELDRLYHLKEVYTRSSKVNDRSVVGGWSKNVEGEWCIFGCQVHWEVLLNSVSLS